MTVVPRSARGGAAGAILLLALAAPACSERGTSGAVAGIEEPSGVARLADSLLVVGDDEPACYFTMPVPDVASGPVPMDPARIQRRPLAHAGDATDLEGIDVLADGRVVVLSEDAHALFDDVGLVVRYDGDLAEVDGRGLEGLAVRPAPDGASDIAVLWEGGYVKSLVPPRPVAHRPRVRVHRLAAGARPGAWAAGDLTRSVELDVFEPPGLEPKAQRFRAPDLVWHHWREDTTAADVDGWIVLLSSGWAERPDAGSVEECRGADGQPLRWCHRWLQRFTLDGRRAGDPFDLDAVLPADLQRKNWEGMGWFEPGRTLVLVYDESVADAEGAPQSAFLLPLPSGW